MTVFCVGLTGGLASGKSTAARAFAAADVTIVDADAVAAEITAADGAAVPALRRVLGDWAFDAAGVFRRDEVRRRVFADVAVRKRLEGVLHPLIRDVMRARLCAATSPYAIGVVPLLFESGGWANYFQRIVVVSCAPALQKTRAGLRDAAADATKIMATQFSAEERLKRADDIIDNNGDIAALEQAVAALHQQYLQSAKIFNRQRH